MFADPYDMVSSMLSEALMGLEPSIQNCITKCMEKDSSQLTFLITLRQVMCVLSEIQRLTRENGYADFLVLIICLSFWSILLEECDFLLCDFLFAEVGSDLRCRSCSCCLVVIVVFFIGSGSFWAWFRTCTGQSSITNTR